MKQQILSTLLPLFNAPRGLVSPANKQLNNALCDIFSFKRISYPSGQLVNGWTIPQSYSLDDAEVIINGTRYTTTEIPLMVPFGCQSFKAEGSLTKLKNFIETDQASPNATPYRTLYYPGQQPFVCLPYYLLCDLSPDAHISIRVSATCTDDKLELLEYTIKGHSSSVILLSTYTCHPGLANDNFSGILSLCYILSDLIDQPKPYYTYKFVLAPETIGAICYLDYLKNSSYLQKVLHCHVLTCLGGQPSNYSYKDSLYPNPYSRYFSSCISSALPQCSIRDYTHDGSDERQYSSPGVQLSSSSLCRNRYYEYPEYHTSLDTLEYMSANHVFQSSDIILSALYSADAHLRIPKSLLFGEPSLHSLKLSFHKGGAYRKDMTSQFPDKNKFFALLNLCNGRYSIEEIQKKSADGLSAAEVLRYLDFFLDLKIVRYS